MRIAWDELSARCEREGLNVRGGFHVRDDDGVPEHDGVRAGTLVLLGHVGPLLWRAFSSSSGVASSSGCGVAPSSGCGVAPSSGCGAAPGLDDWTRSVAARLAGELGAHALFPFDGPPYWPFQRWARRAEPVHPSPLGILIHPRYGLWHGYRAALAFAARLALPPWEDAESPCDRCQDRPCLRACPVSAFTARGYDVASCADHLAAEPTSPCMRGGCLARRACPVGQEHIYPEEQRRFHMRAFARTFAR